MILYILLALAVSYIMLELIIVQFKKFKKKQEKKEKKFSQAFNTDRL